MERKRTTQRRTRFAMSGESDEREWRAVFERV